MTRSNILLHLLAFFGDTCICYVVWPFCFCSIVFIALVDWFLSSGMSLVRKHLPLHVPMLGGCVFKALVAGCSDWALQSLSFLPLPCPGLGSTPGISFCFHSLWPQCDRCHGGVTGEGWLGFGLVQQQSGCSSALGLDCICTQPHWPPPPPIGPWGQGLMLL